MVSSVRSGYVSVSGLSSDAGGAVVSEGSYYVAADSLYVSVCSAEKLVAACDDEYGVVVFSLVAVKAVR